jgi:hypothetical protein
MKKTELSIQDKEALARLYSNEDYKTLVRLLDIFEYNCMVRQARLSHSDPVTRTIWHEFFRGQMFAMRQLKKTVELSAKQVDKED